MLIDMLPAQYIAFGTKASTGYFSFISGGNDRGPTMRVKAGPQGEQVFKLLPQIARLIASQGNNLIVDEILLRDEVLEAYVRELHGQTVYFIGVLCDLEVMQEREILRADRVLGLANDQIDRVHQGIRVYDLTVDTSSTSPFESARIIWDFIQKNPCPQGFEKIKEMFQPKRGYT